MRRHTMAACCLLLSGQLGAQPADTTAVSADPLFVKRDAYYAAGFLAATLAATPLDRYLATRLQLPWAQENRFLAKSADYLRVIGSPGAYIIGGTMYGVGRLAGNERMADLGLHGTEALIIGQVTGMLLKGIFGRQRPYVTEDDPDPFRFKFLRGFEGNTDYRSFPSGHTVSGFAAAAAVTTEARRWWPKAHWAVSTVMYGGATFIGASRMYNNKHWASDVITGALIGSFAGRKMVKYHHSHPDNKIDEWLLSGSIVRTKDGGHAIRWMILPRTMMPSMR